MAIRNLVAVVAAIRAFIVEQAQAAGAKTLVFGLSGGADSALIALLCQGIPGFKSVGVMMPAHSSGSALARATELAEKIGLTTLVVDLSKAHDLISGQVSAALLGIAGDKTNDSEGALRSCLRAPTLDYVAKRTNGIIVGTGNRDEDEVTRYFQKRGDGCVDFSPIAKLHKSEVYELLRFLGCTQAILDAVPTADLWGPDAGQTDEGQLGLKYFEVEWAIKLNDRANDQVFGLGDIKRRVPVDILFTEGRKLDEREKAIIEQLRKMDQASRHKAAMPPVFDVRAVTEVVDGVKQPIVD